MAGIYIHIPFCKQICHYCDFYRSASLKRKPELLKVLEKEIIQRKAYLKNEQIQTIYFGGGTPSVLSSVEIEHLLNTVYSNFEIAKSPEITLEANPEDLTFEYLSEIKKAGVNRLSIGIQSFFEEDLKLMNRRHSSEQSKLAVKNAQNLGFKNITVDLIYGFPDLTIEKWKQNLAQVFELDIQHISAYHLTIEDKTHFAKFLEKGKIKTVEEEVSIKQFKLLISEARKHNFMHYEISNFGLENYFSIHNTNYWKQVNYLGVGPSAHSYNGISRSWNFANINTYIEGVNSELAYFDEEILDKQTKYNEMIMTGLRTMWGVDLENISDEFGCDISEKCFQSARKYIKTNHILYKDEFLKLTDKGKFISDKIMADLFILDEF